MAVKKVYKSKTGSDYHITLLVDGRRVLVSLEGKEQTYITTNEKIQKALESNRYFKKGLIVISYQEESSSEIQDTSIVVDTLPVGEPIKGDKPELKVKTDVSASANNSPETHQPANVDKQNTDTSDTGAGEPAVYDKVTTPSEAREVLMTEPYNLAPQSVQKNPESILKRAAELGVSFPNLKVE